MQRCLVGVPTQVNPWKRSSLIKLICRLFISSKGSLGKSHLSIQGHTMNNTQDECCSFSKGSIIWPKHNREILLTKFMGHPRPQCNIMLLSNFMRWITWTHKQIQMRNMRLEHVISRFKIDVFWILEVKLTNHRWPIMTIVLLLLFPFRIYPYTIDSMTINIIVEIIKWCKIPIRYVTLLWALPTLQTILSICLQWGSDSFGYQFQITKFVTSIFRVKSLKFNMRGQSEDSSWTIT